MSSPGASPRRTKYDSPLNRLRLAAGLSIPELASRFGCSTATISRWCSGMRRAPDAFTRALHAAAVGDGSDIARAQREYAERRRAIQASITVALPAGIDPDEARQLVVSAIANALATTRNGGER